MIRRLSLIAAFILLLSIIMGISVLAVSRNSRLILIKADGLSPDLLAALCFPERQDYWNRISYKKNLRRALDFYIEQTGRMIVLPNIRHYFFEDGVYLENFYSETLTLSPVAWSVIDTGQPSVIKGNATFSRDSSYLRYHLDGLRDTIDSLRVGGNMTASLWGLDQIGVSLMSDAFNPDRTWSSLQFFRRTANRGMLLELGKHWLHNDKNGLLEITKSHLARMATGLDYPELSQKITGLITAKKILEKDLLGEEKYDYISPLFTLIDHQQHVDPHPQNLIHWIAKLDELIGHIFSAVEQSSRKDKTVVALVSDHGSEIQPGKTAFSFPITREFRTQLFGGHTVKTMLVENSWSSLTTPVAGIDSPRIYESQDSPYGEHSGGEKGFVTCFIDNFGNGRSAINLRNDDLNRLHLLLQKIKLSNPKSKSWNQMVSMFRDTWEKTRKWLEPDLVLYEDYHEGAKDMAADLLSETNKHLFPKTPMRPKNIAWRLKQEAKRDATQIASLKLLLSLRFSDDNKRKGPLFEKMAQSDFKISSLIPKGFLGIPNQIIQLSRYTIGLDQDLKWITTTVDSKGKRIPLNYYSIFSEYKAPNKPDNGNPNPSDLIVTRLPNPKAIEALQTIAWRKTQEQRIRNVVWIKSTTRNRSDKGGEALIIETLNGNIQYLPIEKLVQSEDHSIRFILSKGPDPLGLIDHIQHQTKNSASTLDWFSQFHPREDWLEGTFSSAYSTAICTILDIINDPTEVFIDSPDFQHYLTQFSSPDKKERYLRGLKRKYANQQPDFRVWSSELWNFNSSTRTAGGSHSGFRPIVSRTAFLVWGGNDTKVDKGKTVSKVGTTLDLVPTLAQALGMLDKNNKIISKPGSTPERVFVPFPGKVLNIFRP